MGWDIGDIGFKIVLSPDVPKVVNEQPSRQRRVLPRRQQSHPRRHLQLHLPLRRPQGPRSHGKHPQPPANALAPSWKQPPRGRQSLRRLRPRRPRGRPRPSTPANPAPTASSPPWAQPSAPNSSCSSGSSAHPAVAPAIAVAPAFLVVIPEGNLLLPSLFCLSFPKGIRFCPLPAILPRSGRTHPRPYPRQTPVIECHFLVNPRNSPTREASYLKIVMHLRSKQSDVCHRRRRTCRPRLRHRRRSSAAFTSKSSTPCAPPSTRPAAKASCPTPSKPSPPSASISTAISIPPKASPCTAFASSATPPPPATPSPPRPPSPRTPAAASAAPSCIQLLLDRAASLGVRFHWQNVRPRHRNRQQRRHLVHTSSQTLRARYLIGADGHQSRIARLGRSRRQLHPLPPHRPPPALRHRPLDQLRRSLLEQPRPGLRHSHLLPRNLCRLRLPQKDAPAPDHALAHFPALQRHLTAATPSGRPARLHHPRPHSPSRHLRQHRPHRRRLRLRRRRHRRRSRPLLPSGRRPRPGAPGKRPRRLPARPPPHPAPPRLMSRLCS